MFVRDFMLLVFTAEYIVESYDFIFEGFLVALDRICPVSSSERQEHRALEYLKLFLKINDYKQLHICTSLDDNDLVIHVEETPAKWNQSWIHPVFDLMRVCDVVEVWVEDLLSLFVKTETDLAREEQAHSPGSQ